MKTPSAHNTEIIGGWLRLRNARRGARAVGPRHARHGVLAARAFGTAGIVRIARPDPRASSPCSTTARSASWRRTSIRRTRRATSSPGRTTKAARAVSGIGRGGEYGARGADHIAFADKTTTVIAMIEDRQAIEVIDEIAAVAGIDCMFSGAAISACRSATPRARRPRSRRPSRSSRRRHSKHDKPLAAVVPSMTSDEAKWLMDLGVTAMMVLSDQGSCARLRPARCRSSRSLTAAGRPEQR